MLEKLSKKIKVDRIIKVSGDEKILLTEEKEVLSEVRSHFMKQFWKRNINKNGLSARWAKTYSLIKKIDNKIYKDLLSKVTEEDWASALNKTKNKSAPGILGISYPLIKRAR